MSVYDEMENRWGVDFVQCPTKPVRKTRAMFDGMIKQSVPGYQLYNIQASGTDSNMVAMLAASDYNLNSCLFALGSYLGGDQYLQDLSTSMYDPSSCLSVPKYPENASTRCFQQTVPLPYSVPGGLDEATLQEFEEKCLRAFHKKVALMALNGKPCRALLLEYILGGNGALLSVRFLERLGALCKECSIVIVADEVLSGGRVGAFMAMTPSMPTVVQEVVEYITMGKFIGCSIVLKRLPKKPTTRPEKLRGTSTSQDCGLPCSIWEKVVVAKAQGDLQKRQKEVLKAMQLDRNPDDYWGMDLLLYSNKKRPQMMHALKNRMLPMLVVGMKIRQSKCVKSKWTRYSVSEVVQTTAQEWLIEQEAALGKSPCTGFLSHTVDYLFSCGSDKLEPRESNEYQYFRLRPEDVCNFLGKAKAAKLADDFQMLRREEGRACNMTALSFVKEALFQAGFQSNLSTNETKLVKKKKKTLKRIEYTFVHSSLFGKFNESDEFVYLS